MASTDISSPPEPAFSACKASILHLRQLLIQQQALYGGLVLGSLFIGPVLSVAFEALSSASPQSTTYEPSAQMSFLSALRMLRYMCISFESSAYAILAVKQAAARSSFPLSEEAKEIFEYAVDMLAPRAGGPDNQPMANWVVDYHRSGANVETARLDVLIQEMNDMAIERP